MGLEGNNNGDMMGLDLGLVDDEEAKETKIKVRVFINFDEDDDNKYKIDLNDLFKREDASLPFYVDVSCSLSSFMGSICLLSSIFRLHFNAFLHNYF